MSWLGFYFLCMTMRWPLSCKVAINILRSKSVTVSSGGLLIIDILLLRVSRVNFCVISFSVLWTFYFIWVLRSLISFSPLILSLSATNSRFLLKYSFMKPISVGSLPSSASELRPCTKNSTYQVMGPSVISNALRSEILQFWIRGKMGDLGTNCPIPQWQNFTYKF